MHLILGKGYDRRGSRTFPELAAVLLSVGKDIRNYVIMFLISNVVTQIILVTLPPLQAIQRCTLN